MKYCVTLLVVLSIGLSGCGILPEEVTDVNRTELWLLCKILKQQDDRLNQLESAVEALNNKGRQGNGKETKDSK